MSKRNNEILALLEALKQQTDELLANQLLYTEMVDNNADGLLVVNDDGIICFANKTAAEMFHFKKAKKLEGEIFAFDPVENEVAEIEIASNSKVSTVEMRSRKIEWSGKPAKLVFLRSSTERGKIRSSLQRTSASLKTMINASPLAIIVLDMAGCVNLWNRMAEDIFGWSEIEMRGQSFPFNDSPLEDLYEQVSGGESVFKKEISGSFGLYGLARVFNVWATPLHNPTDAISGVMLMIAEVTESKLQKKQMESALLKSEKRFRMALSNSPISVSSQDKELRYTWVYNPLAGLHEAQMLGKCDHELFLPEDAAQLSELKNSALQDGIENRGEIKIQRDGHLYFYDLSVEPLFDDDGNIGGITCAATDISALRHSESLATFALHHDTLTGLPNRMLFRDRLQQALVLAQREGDQCLAVIHFGIDQFKTINQCFGHTVGDQLLLEVSSRMAEVMYEIDTVARVGGDEFLILAHNIQNSQDASSIVRKIMQSLQQSFTINEQEIFLSASIGVAVYPNDGDTADDLLKNADAAMHRAKEDIGRGNYQFFCADMNFQAMQKLTLEGDLRHALEREAFHLHYQPQVDIRNNVIIAAEALLRWTHPEKGNIPPAEFIPAAESSGLIGPIGDWVLQTACRQHRTWLEAGLAPIRIAVNLSALQFLHGDLVDKVAHVLAINDMDPAYLELELTESMLMHDVENTIKTLCELKRMGVRLSIDDFGTGYSSLSYLKRFPLDILKIDRSFVTDIGTDSDNGEIARTIIAVAHALGLEVVVEGVETQQQLDFMHTARCDLVQGYFFSKPLPADECAKLLTGHPMERPGLLEPRRTARLVA